MDVQTGIFTQAELCKITGLDSVTVDTWLLRGIMHTTKVGGRILRGRRLFSVLAIFEAAVIGELVTHLAIPPSEAAKVAKCATADWNAPDDWKSRVIKAVDRSASIASVFLILVRRDDDWVTITSYGNKAPWVQPHPAYEKWLTRPFAVLPAADLLSSVYKKCREISKDSGGEAR